MSTFSSQISTFISTLSNDNVLSVCIRKVSECMLIRYQVDLEVAIDELLVELKRVMDRRSGKDFLGRGHLGIDFSALDNSVHEESGNGNIDEVTVDALMLLVFFVNEHLHENVMHVILNTLEQLGEFAEFWKLREERGGFHWTEIGAEKWWPNLPFYSLATGSFELWKQVMFSRHRSVIANKIKLLEEYEQNFLESAGEIYSRMHRSKSFKSEVEIDLCAQVSNELFRFITGKESGDLHLVKQDRPAVRRNLSESFIFSGLKRDGDRLSRLVQILHVQLESLKHVNVFKNRTNFLISPLKPPSRFQRYWIWYLIGGTALICLLSRIYKYGDVIGDSAVQLWLTFTTFINEHIVYPINNIWTSVFRYNKSNFNKAELLESKQSLERMLREFSRQRNRLTDGNEMQFLMQEYEAEIRRPVVNVVTGDLIQGMLIQVQKLKVDTQATMLALDSLLQANEISFELGATIPAILVFYPVYNSVIYPLLFKKTVPLIERQRKKEIRTLLWKIDRSLAIFATTNANTVLPTLGLGTLLFLTTKLQKCAFSLLDDGEIRMLRIDLDELRRPNMSIISKRTVFERIVRTQNLFQSNFLQTIAFAE